MSSVGKFEALRGTVLIVENDLEMARLQEESLTKIGHSVYCVDSAAQALDFLSKHSLDLIIIDFNIGSDINGIDLFLLIRERGYVLPAILVTSFEDPHIILRAMRSGLRDLLPKGSNFLKGLPLAVERLLKQMAIERRAAESEMIREKQELLETAFEAAVLGSIIWNIGSDSLSWAGHINDMFGFNVERRCRSMDDFMLLLNLEDRSGFMQSLEGAKKAKMPFVYQFRLNEQPGRWYSAKGKFYYDSLRARAERMICVVSDVTERKLSELELVHSNNKIKALNDRLQMGMIEAHHRIKNSLQSIISLLNLELRKQGTLTPEDVKKLTAHINAFASLHAILVDQVKSDGSTTSVSLDQILTRIIEALDRAGARRIKESVIEPCRVTSRRASSLSVILNELLSNALKHSTGSISIFLERQESGKGTLRVLNEGSAFPDLESLHDPNTNAFALVKLLAGGDLDSQPTFVNHPDNRAEVRIDFPLESH